MDMNNEHRISKCLLTICVLTLISFYQTEIAISNEPMNEFSATKSEYGDIPIKGPVFISNIYPVTSLKATSVSIISNTARGYDLAGKSIVSDMIEKYYFPTALSYPYQFSDEGIEELKRQLQTIPLVDSESFEIGSLPNIPEAEQYQYTKDQLQSILIEEKYVKFTLKGWDHISFLRFPTFLVVNFDFAEQAPNSYEDYKNEKKYWKDKTKEFSQLDDLAAVLGISRRENKWSASPLLVFCSLSSYHHDVNFMNRYIFGPSSEADQRTKLFVEEVTLNGGSLDLRSIRHFESITHDWSPANVWRFYYSFTPIFQVGRESHVLEMGDHSSQRSLIRILRSALLVHVVLPESGRLAQQLNDEIVGSIGELETKRLEIFRTFSRRDLDTFRMTIHQHEKNIYPKVLETVARIEGVERAGKRLFGYFEDPFHMPLGRPEMQISPADYQSYIEGYRKLFHFEKPFNYNNDLKKTEVYLSDLRTSLESIHQNLPTYVEELQSGRELAENRMQIVEGRLNTFWAIAVPAVGAFLGFLCYVFWNWRNLFY